MYSALALLFPALLAAIGWIVGAQPGRARSGAHGAGLAASIWFRRAQAFGGSDMLTGLFILLIAILTTLNLILLFPSLGAVFEQCNQF